MDLRGKKVFVTVADNTLIKELINWKSNYTIDEGLPETLEWIKNIMKYCKTDIYNV